MMVLDVHEVLFRMSSDPLERIVPFVKAHGSALSDDEIIELHRQATLGRMRSPAFWEACGVVGDPEQLDAELLAGIRLQHGAKEFLREMHRRGVPVAVVTNDLVDWSHQLRDLHGLAGVTPWIVSSEIGVRKPDPAAYEALRRTTGVPYFSMVVVDGQIPALDTARTLGTMTAWFARHKPPDGAEPGHAVITKFGDFFRRRSSANPQPPVAASAARPERLRDTGASSATVTPPDQTVRHEPNESRVPVQRLWWRGRQVVGAVPDVPGVGHARRGHGRGCAGR